jgi:predicted phosphodiesterase
LSKTAKDKLAYILDTIRKTAKELSIPEYQVSKAQFMQQIDESLVNDWTVRQLGGFNTIRNTYFPQQEKELAVIRQEKEISSYVRKLEKTAAEKMVLNENLGKMIRESLKDLKLEKVKLPVLPVRKGQKMTMELMLSDIHYGKKTKTFNLEVCRTRMKNLSTVFLQELQRKTKEGYNVERIILALLGDVIESYTMHGLESAVGCEFGNAQQCQAAITSLFNDVILPIARTGVKIDVPCVTGNHDRTEHSRTMNDPGLNNMTWIIYTSLQELCKTAGLTNVSFEIAKGSYIIGKVYENNILWEHGDNCKSPAKRSFEGLMEQRGRQNNVTVHFGRFGHWHEYAVFDRGRIIVNESVCGMDSYAEVKGFDSKAGQTINFYVETKNRPNCFYHSFAVDLSSK